MKILNKIGSMLLIICLLSNLGNSFPRFSFAMNNSIYSTYKELIESKYTEAERLVFKETIDELIEYKGRKESKEGTLYASDITEEQILYYLIEYKGKRVDLKDDNNKKINPYVYKKYKILAYDDIGVIEGSKTGNGSFEEVTTVEGVEREYRYLGYSKTSTLITNDFYPADFKSGTDPLTRNYKPASDALGSWKSFNNKNPHYGQLYQLMNTNLKNDDVTDGVYKPVGYTAFDLLRLSSFPAYSANAYIGDAAVKIAQSKMVMMQMPSLGSTGQFKLVHGSNQRYYDTFRTQDMTLSAEVFIYPSESVYFIAPGQEEVTIQYEVRTIIDESKTSLPYSNGLNITRVSIQSEGKKEEVFENKFKVNKTLDRVLSTTFSRTINLSHLDLSDGKDTIVLSASSQYTDMTDYMISFKANPVVVTINGKSDFLADFTIHEATGDDVTDARIMIKDLYFKTPVNVSVKDASVTSKGNIISRTWSVLKNDSYRILSTGNESDVVFAVTEANKASVLNANKLSFKLEVKTDQSDETEIAIHEVTFAKSAPPQATPAGPVAIIAAKLDQNSNDDYLAMEGEVFQLHGRDSYHPEGLKLKTFKFNTNGGFVSSTGGKKNDYIYYLDSGKYYPELTVTDVKGGRDTDDTVIKIKRAEFIPVITVEGALKENREVTISVKNEHNLRKMPIDESSLDWTITPLDGQGEVIKIVGAADGHLNFRSLFKKKGRYQVSVSGDIAGGSKRYSATTSTVISIAEDMAPIADFEISKRQIRDVRNDNMTEMIIYDKSYSPDGDIIVQRKYWYRYDQDNDDEFTDTDWIMISAANFDRMSAFSDQVGGYQFKIEVKENFGQTTITEFIVDADYKRGNSDLKAEEDKEVEIINIAPTVSLEISNKKPVNLIVYHDYDEVAFTNFKNKVEILKAQMLGKQIELSVDYLTPTKIVGSREVWTTYFDTYISVDIYVEGEGESDSPWTSGSEWDINEKKTFNFYLDSFTSEGNESDMTNSKNGRFELVDVSFGNSGYKKYNYKGRSRDYSEFAYKELNVTYKDNGIEKVVTYNFVYDWREYEKDSDGDKWDDSIVYTKYDLAGSKLNVDVPYMNRPQYVRRNYLFEYNARPETFVSLPQNTKRDVQLKLYDENQLDLILSDCENEDTFFINLCENEENRLALNRKLYDKLAINNISYATLEKDSLRINPLSGRYDNLLVGDMVLINIENHFDIKTYANDLIIQIGHLAYRLDQMNQRYFFLGKYEDVKESYNDIYGGSTDSTYVESGDGGVYTNGYKYEENYHNNILYGLAAINKMNEKNDNEEVNVWNSWKIFRKTSTDRDKFANSFSAGFYDSYCHNLSIMPDGKLIGTRLYFDRYNSDFHKRAIYYGSNFVGKLKNVYYKRYFSWNSRTEDRVHGLVHENGNIYFKQGNGKYAYGFINKVVVTEGIDNIRYMEVRDAEQQIYVYTDNLVVRYDISDGSRHIITNGFTERNGNAVKISDSTWKVYDEIFEGYKELYYNKSDAYGVSYINHSQSYNVTVSGYFKAYIDENDKYYIERKVKGTGQFSSTNRTSKTLIAEDVRTLPLVSQYGTLPIATSPTGDLSFSNDIFFSYIGNDGMLYNADNINDATSMISTETLTKENTLARPENYGKIKRIERAGSGYIAYRNGVTKIDTTKSKTLENFENGTLSIFNTFGKYGLKDIVFKYANLTIGSPGDVVGDSQLISVTATSKAFKTLNDLMDGVYEVYENYSSSNSIYVLLGETIETTMNYDDYEKDESFSQVYDFIHADPNYFENSLGKDPAAGTGLLEPLTILNYVGHYVVKPKVKDNPKDDNRFDEYRLTNNDEVKVNVYVHRKPIPQMTFRFGENELDPSFFTLTCVDSGSYDIDHLSEPAKGIIDWEFSIIGEDDDEWIRVNQNTFTHTRIEAGKDYKIAYRVKDKEGAWSKYLKKTFVIEDLPINLNAKLKAQDEPFSIQAIPITEILSLYDIETEYSRPLRLEIALYEGDIRKGNLISIPFSEGLTAVTDTNNSTLVKWNERTLQVPESLPDKAYKLRITAIDTSNPSKRAELEFDVTVRTPVNLFPEVSPEELLTEEAYELKAFTSKYVASLTVKAFKNSVHEKSIALALDGEVIANMKKWIKGELVPQMTEGEYTFEFIATTPNGNTERASLVKKVQNMKLFDFNVFQVSDYDLKSLFESGEQYFVKDLALEKLDGPLMKMGYAFYFELSSKGLKDSTDEVKITPSFIDQYGRALDMYYDDEQSSYILGVSESGATDSRDAFELYYSGKMKRQEKLGKFSKLSLPTALRTINIAESEEVWRGRYGLPLSTIFTLPGQDPKVERNRIITPITIRFKLEAYKDKKLVYDYVLSGQWEKERLNEHGNPVNSTKYSRYKPGDIIVIDPSKDGKEDFEVRPVW